MPIIDFEILAQGSILDDPVGSKPRFLRGDWLTHEIRTKNLSIIDEALIGRSIGERVKVQFSSIRTQNEDPCFCLFEVWGRGKTQISESILRRRKRQERDIVSICQRLTMSQWEHNFRKDMGSSVQPSTSISRAILTSKASLLPIATSTTPEGPVVRDGPVCSNKKRRLDRTASENSAPSSLQHERKHDRECHNVRHHGPSPKMEEDFP